MSTRSRRLALLAVLVLVGCETRPGPAVCSDAGAVNYESFASAATPPLCDNQHLIASLSPTAVDPRAGEGRLELPLAIEVKELRRYCMQDDNGEAHRAEVLSDSGEVLVSLLADGLCKEVELEVGLYQLRLTHDDIGMPDDTPDIVHTLLRPRDGNTAPTFLLSVNSCPGCNLANTNWPIFDNVNGDDVYGYTGDYHGANLSGGKCLRLSSRGTSHFLCRLGTFGGGESQFDDVTLARTIIDPKADSFDILDGSFLRIDLTGVHVVGPVTTVESSTLSLTAPIPGFVSGVRMGRSDVDPLFLRAFMDSAFHISDGKNYLFSASNTFDDVVIDFQNVITAIDGPVDEAGTLDLSGATFKRSSLVSPSLLRKAQRVDFSHADFTDATLLGGTLSALSLRAAVFDRAALTSTTLCQPGGCDASGSSFRDAKLTDVHVERSTFAQSHWDRATVASLHASAASFASAMLTELKRFDDVAAPDSFWNDATISLGTNVSANRLAVPRSDWSRVVANNFSAPSAIFDNAKLEGAVFAGANLASAVLTNANLAGADLSSAILTQADLSNARGAANLHAAQADNAIFTSARLGATDLTKANLTRSRASDSVWCGATVDGSIMNGAVLSRALFPAKDASFLIDGRVQDCNSVKTSLAVVTTDAQTTCPDASFGPCSGTQWSATAFGPGCCKYDPNNPSSCKKRKSQSASCTSPCDCVSLGCTAGLCN